MPSDGVIRRPHTPREPDGEDLGDRPERLDTEELGRRLIERQSPAEREQARLIFRRMLDGASPDDLRREIGQLHRIHRHVAARRRS
jgi:hypothetical protein